ncbi:hypothetical protein Tco_1395019 [Tanacetum coccineum]
MMITDGKDGGYGWEDGGYGWEDGGYGWEDGGYVRKMVVIVPSGYEAKYTVPVGIRCTHVLDDSSVSHHPGGRNGAEEVQSIIHIKAEKCKKMKLSQDMQLIQKRCHDQKRMKKVFEVMSGRNIVTNSRMTPYWREIVSLTFSEAGVLHVNWTSFGHCVSRRGLLC